MPPVESLDPDNDMWHWIAVELRFWRERASYALSRMAQIMGTAKSVVSNIEHGRPSHRMNEHHAKALDQHFQLGDHFKRLVRYARAGHSPHWFREHVGYEQRSLVMRLYELALVPGLFQTADYARTILVAGQTVPDVETALAVRMDRQKIITCPQPPAIWALLAEPVLEYPIGGAETMRGQLAHLLELGELPHVSIRIVPRDEGFHLGLEGPFMVTTVKEGAVAYLESCGGGRLEQSKPQVLNYETRWSRIGDVALPIRASRDLIRSKMEALT